MSKIQETLPLHLRLRPETLEEMVGQDAVVESLQRLLKSGHIPHAFLFTGPSGVGKTTLARIMAQAVGAKNSITEVDAATYSGVDTMRDITATAIYTALGAHPQRFFIIDECHALSKATWQSLLKSLEEPPKHAYWALCTTESDKVPTTIRTRCHTYDLKPVKKEVLFDYLEKVVKVEKLDVPDAVLQYIVDKSEGSVRLALQFLSMTDGVSTRAEAHEVLSQVVENEEVIDLVRKLVAGKGLTWKGIMSSLQKVEDQSPETIRLIMVNYLAIALKGTGDEKQVVRLLNILEPFKEPFRSNEKLAPLLLAIGRIFFEE